MPINFTLVATNPNDSTGGGGTLSAEMHDADAVGPYFVWGATEMESGISPYVVVAASEVRAMYAALNDEPIAGGEADTHPEAVAQHTGAGQGDESRVYDLGDPLDFAAFSRGG